jgi:hypothetical protein
MATVIVAAAAVAITWRLRFNIDSFQKVDHPGGSLPVASDTGKIPARHRCGATVSRDGGQLGRLPRPHLVPSRTGDDRIRGCRVRWTVAHSSVDGGGADGGGRGGDDRSGMP